MITKKIRDAMSDKMNCCHCCDRPFELNKETVSLVCFNNRVGNKTVCGDCFDKLEFKDGKS